MRGMQVATIYRRKSVGQTVRYLSLANTVALCRSNLSAGKKQRILLPMALCQFLIRDKEVHYCEANKCKGVVK